MMPKDQNIVRLYQIAKVEAKRAVGGDQAFRFLGPDIRRALVSKEVLNLLYCQDDEISGDTLKKLIDSLINELTDDADFLV